MDFVIRSRAHFRFLYFTGHLSPGKSKFPRKLCSCSIRVCFGERFLHPLECIVEENEPTSAIYELKKLSALAYWSHRRNWALPAVTVTQFNWFDIWTHFVCWMHFCFKFRYSVLWNSNKLALLEARGYHLPRETYMRECGFIVRFYATNAHCVRQKYSRGSPRIGLGS